MATASPAALRRRLVPPSQRASFPGTREPPVRPLPMRLGPAGTLVRANSFESELGETDDGDGDGDQSADEAAADRAAPPHDAETTAAGLAEKKRYKKLVRATSAAAMFAAALCVLYLGHLAVCALVFVIQVMIFKEVTMVRYRTEKSSEVPMFRTIQWLWFAVAIFFSYGDALSNTMPTPLSKWLHRRKHRLAVFAFFIDNHEVITLLSYSAVFILTVLSFKKHYYKYQMGQLSWTMVTVWICVGQLHAVVTNIFTGLFWFVYPVSLVVVNDCMAYFCGQAFGRKLIKVRRALPPPRVRPRSLCASPVDARTAPHRWRCCAPTAFSLRAARAHPHARAHALNLPPSATEHSCCTRSPPRVRVAPRPAPRARARTDDHSIWVHVVLKRAAAEREVEHAAQENGCLLR